MEKKIGWMIKKNNAKRIATMIALLVALSACFALPGAFATETGPDPGEEYNGSIGEEGEDGDPGGDAGGEAPDESGGDASEETSGGTTSESSAPTSDDLRSDLKGVRGELEQARGNYDQAVQELVDLEAKIAELTEQIRITEEDIEILQGQIDEYSEILNGLLERIIELEGDIYDHNSSLNKRLRIMYATGDQSMLAVLLGSENFVDFLSNIEMVRRIHESDKAFLVELEEKLDEVEQNKAEAERIDQMLKGQRDSLQERKDQLDADKESLAAAKRRVQEIRDKAAEDIDRLEKESKKIELELVNMTSKWGDYAGGAMAWPVIGPITSEFGMRVHPITGRYAMHTGIDIGVPTGTAVHAGADGIVYFSGWNSGGYGNLVMIDNGSGIVTLYAHNSSLAVSAGTVVHRGDIVAYAGSTGNSTGPHVHFEVRVNGSPQNPRGWLG